MLSALLAPMSEVACPSDPQNGLRGCRVGEASNPGLHVRRRRRVLSSVSRSDRIFSSFFQRMEEDLRGGASVQCRRAESPSFLDHKLVHAESSQAGPGVTAEHVKILQDGG